MFNFNSERIAVSTSILSVIVGLSAFFNFSHAATSEDAALVNPNVYVSDNFKKKVTSSTRITLLVDACVTHDTYFSIKDSDYFKSEILRLAVPYLTKMGYRVDVKPIPAVCAMLSNTKQVAFSPIDGKSIRNATPPLWINSVPKDVNADSLNRLFSDTHSAVAGFAHNNMKFKLKEIEEHDEWEGDDFDDNPEKNRKKPEKQNSFQFESYKNTHAVSILNSEESEIILVLVGDGTLVSPDIASANITGGMVVGAMFGGFVGVGMAVASIESHYFISAAMYDAKNGELLWKNLGFLPLIQFPEEIAPVADDEEIDTSEFDQTPSTIIDAKFSSRNIMAVSALFALPKQPVQVVESDGVDAIEIHHLLVGNTLSGKMQNGDDFSAFFSPLGRFYGVNMDEHQSLGYWYVDDSDRLCLVLSTERCGALKAIGKGHYQLHKEGAYKATITSITEGNTIQM